MGARVCEPPPLCLCLCVSFFVLTLMPFSPSSFPQIEAYVLVSVETWWDHPWGGGAVLVSSLGVRLQSSSQGSSPR